MICIKCKKEIQDDSVFCPYCGRRQAPEKRKTLKRANGMGSAFKATGRRRKPWAAKIGKTFIGYYETKTEALAAIESLSKKQIPDAFNITIDEVYERWAAERLGGLTDHGADSYKNSWKHFTPILGKKMRDLRTCDYQDIIDALVQAGRKRASCEKVKSLMTQLNKWAMRENIVDKDYSGFITLPKAEKEEKKIFSDSDIELLFKNANNPSVRIILILIYTGLRIGELMHALKDKVYLEQDYLIAGEKSEAGKDRVIPINPKVKPFISELYCSAEDGGRLMSGYSGNKETNNFRNREFNPVLESLGLFDFTPHSTRHTCASLMVAAGVPREQIQKILGHAQYSTTADYYVHANIDQLVDAISKI